MDDEPELVSLLREWLEEVGCEVHSALNALDGLELFCQHSPILIIADLRMPGMDGFQLISRIRDMSDAYILALTALGSEEHMVRGLELGADEYVVKPVPKRVFLARVQSILRRATQPVDHIPDYSDGCISINYLTREVSVHERGVHLRPTEFRILALLSRNCDRVITHQELLERIWGDQGGSLESLRWYISSLRQKLEEGSCQHRLILTIPRIGYRYRPPD